MADNEQGDAWDQCKEVALVGGRSVRCEIFRLDEHRTHYVTGNDLTPSIRWGGSPEDIANSIREDLERRIQW